MSAMIDFSTIPAPEKEMIIRLPYRVGLWVSESDDIGGEESDLRELQTLKIVLISYVEDFCKSEFVQRVMEQTVAQKKDWETWGDDIPSVPQECKQVMSFLSGKIPSKELTSFQDNLIEIGQSVAMAYREFDDENPLGERIQIYLKLWSARLRAFLKGEALVSQDELLNISVREQDALDALVKSFSSVLEENVPEDEGVIDQNGEEDNDNDNEEEDQNG